MPSVPSVTMKGSMLPVRQAEQHAHRDRGAEAEQHHGGRRAQVRRQGVHQQDLGAGDQRGHRADRQVDAAADDHEAHAHGDDADERGAREHVHHVVPGAEVRVQQLAREADEHQPDQRARSHQPAPEAAGESRLVGAARIGRLRLGRRGDGGGVSGCR
jgi:hypothetical protein